eukprot:gene9177-biopygen16708
MPSNVLWTHFGLPWGGVGCAYLPTGKDLDTSPPSAPTLTGPNSGLQHGRPPGGTADKPLVGRLRNSAAKQYSRGPVPMQQADTGLQPCCGVVISIRGHVSPANPLQRCCNTLANLCTNRCKRVGARGLHTVQTRTEHYNTTRLQTPLSRLHFPASGNRPTAFCGATISLARGVLFFLQNLPGDAGGEGRRGRPGRSDVTRVKGAQLFPSIFLPLGARSRPGVDPVSKEKKVLLSAGGVAGAGSSPAVACMAVSVCVAGAGCRDLRRGEPAPRTPGAFGASVGRPRAGGWRRGGPFFSRIPPWHAYFARFSRVRAAMRTAPGARKVWPDDTDELREVLLAHEECAPRTEEGSTLWIGPTRAPCQPWPTAMLLAMKRVLLALKRDPVCGSARLACHASHGRRQPGVNVHGMLQDGDKMNATRRGLKEDECGDKCKCNPQTGTRLMRPVEVPTRDSQWRTDHRGVPAISRLRYGGDGKTAQGVYPGTSRHWPQGARKGPCPDVSRDKRKHTRTGRGPDAGCTIEFKGNGRGPDAGSVVPPTRVPARCGGGGTRGTAGDETDCNSVL